MYPDFDQSFARLGHVRLRSVVHKTWAYQDSNKSSQVIGISVLRLIIYKTWAYQLRHDQSLARLGLIKIAINHSQDFGISRLRSIVHFLRHESRNNEQSIANYRNVLKNWDTQRIGTSLKIVKIIILADPKNWTILRKRKNIRNFSDPKNWDGVFGAPK